MCNTAASAAFYARHKLFVVPIKIHQHSINSKYPYFTTLRLELMRIDEKNICFSLKFFFDTQI